MLENSIQNSQKKVEQQFEIDKIDKEIAILQIEASKVEDTSFKSQVQREIERL